MRADLQRLLKRCLVLGSPLGAIVLLYVFCDPFKVLYVHDNYYDPQDCVTLNRDFISTQIYLSQPAEAIPDSFIFGNSRSLAFHCSDWQQNIDSQRAFHFDASAETLFGIWSKIQYIDRTGGPLRNVLLVIDAEVLQGSNNSHGHLFVKDPRISGESRIAFQMEFFRAFLARGFFVRYLDWRLSGKVRFNVDIAIKSQEYGHTLPSNDVFFDGVEAQIESLGEAYFEPQRGNCPPRDPSPQRPGKAVIGDAQAEMLRDIQKVLAKQGTKYRIVISPLYNQVPLNPDDLGLLKSIFAGDKVFDYSGSNELTRDVHNYYEASHYRPSVAKAILRDLYVVNADQTDVAPVERGR